MSAQQMVEGARSAVDFHLLVNNKPTVAVGAKSPKVMKALERFHDDMESWQFKSGLKHIYKGQCHFPLGSGTRSNKHFRLHYISVGDGWNSCSELP